MNSDKSREEFLNEMLEFSQLGYNVNKNFVYGNLVRQGVTQHRKISDHFKYFTNRFSSAKNIKVFVSDNWKYFCQFKNEKIDALSGYEKIKIYIPMNYDCIKLAADKVFSYLSIENIPHISKIGSDERIDDIVIRTDSMDTALEINKIVSSSKLKNGLLPRNPFAFTDGILSYAWDGALSYNMVVSKLIANFININKHTKESVTSLEFSNYVKKLYEDTFVRGLGISSFVSLMEIDDNQEQYEIENELVNYAGVMKILISSMKSSSKMSDFYENYKEIISDNFYNQISSVICQKNQNNQYAVPMVGDNQIDSSIKQLWKETYAFMVNKYGAENANCYINRFINTGDYRSFTRDGNIRYKMCDNGITPHLVKILMYEEKIDTLKNASIDTINKYDYTQLYVALKNLTVGSYRYFTNACGNRDKLKNTVFPYEVEKIIKQYLASIGYYVEDINDIYEVFCNEIASERTISMKR